MSNNGLRLDQVIAQVNRRQTKYEQNEEDRKIDLEDAMDAAANRPSQVPPSSLFSDVPGMYDDVEDDLPDIYDEEYECVRDDDGVQADASVNEEVESVETEDISSAAEMSELDMPSEAVKAPSTGGSSINGHSVESGSKRVVKAKPEASEKVVKGKTERITKEPRPKGQFSYVRDVPRLLLDLIFQEFPSAANQTDALVAYLICHGNAAFVKQASSVLTPEQKELVRKYHTKQEVPIETRLDEITARVQKLGVSVDVLEMMLGYMTFDRVGFRTDNPTAPQNVNFMENGVLDLILRAEEQTTQMRYRRNIAKGRPKS